MTRVDYVSVLVIRAGRDGHDLLMARRADGRYMGGTWQLVSGGLEPDETAWQAALRELREETGLVPREFYRLSTLTSFYRPDTDSLNVAPMFCALVGDDAVVRLNAEHTEMAWVSLDEATRRLMWPADRQALEEVRSVILGGAPAKPHLRIFLEP
jgi:dihydroneopterin triphosphate diphosphatase